MSIICPNPKSIHFPFACPHTVQKWMLKDGSYKRECERCLENDKPEMEEFRSPARRK